MSEECRVTPRRWLSAAYYDVVGNTLVVALLTSMTIRCRWRKAANQAAFLLDDMV